MSVFDQLQRPLPDYYDTMYKDGYKPWEIVEAAHRAIIKHYNEVQAERVEANNYMDVNFNVEVKSR